MTNQSSGKYRGVAATILQENPMAMYIHCNAHILKLSLVSTCKSIQEIGKVFHIIQTIYNFIEESSKRHGISQKLREEMRNFETEDQQCNL